MKNTFMILATCFTLFSVHAQAQFADTSRSYILPTLTKNNQGEAVLYWTEKDDKNVLHLYFSVSKDAGKTFGDKKLIYADGGLGASKLARPRLLFKKDGAMVAFFTHRSGGATPPQQRPTPPVAQESSHDNHGKTAAGHDGGHGHAEKPAAPAPSVARPKRETQIKFTVSKDGGTTWTAPESVDTDTSKLVRGFFDVVILPNDEMAVAYLKDVKGSTKHEERDLRLALTKNGVFQEEKLIDPVVCDCCNISLLVDNKGAFHVFYRDNNDNIRDIAEIVSKDNGATFSKPTILHNDKWKIDGCPHSGAASVATKNAQYITWFSGTQNGESGIRLAHADGKLIKILGSSAKNATLSADAEQALLVWEQTSENGTSGVFYGKIKNDKIADNQSVSASINGQNAYSLLLNGKVVIAYEVLKADKKTTIQWFAEK